LFQAIQLGFHRLVSYRQTKDIGDQNLVLTLYFPAQSYLRVCKWMHSAMPCLLIDDNTIRYFQVQVFELASGNCMDFRQFYSLHPNCCQLKTFSSLATHRDWNPGNSSTEFPSLFQLSVIRALLPDFLWGQSFIQSHATSCSSSL